MPAQETNPTTIINYRTKKNLKDAFFSLCKEQNVSATARLNDYMRQTLKENGISTTTSPAQPSQKTNQVNADWRDELLRA